MATFERQAPDASTLTVDDLRSQLAEGEALLARLAETLQGADRELLQRVLTATKTLDAIEVAAWPPTGTGQLLVQQAQSAGYKSVVDYIARDGFDAGGVKWTTNDLRTTLNAILGAEQQRCQASQISTS